MIVCKISDLPGRSLRLGVSAIRLLPNFRELTTQDGAHGYRMVDLGRHFGFDMDLGLHHRRSHSFLRRFVGTDEFTFRFLLRLDLLGHCIPQDEKGGPGTRFLRKERNSWLGRLHCQRLHHLRWVVLRDRRYLCFRAEHHRLVRCEQRWISILLRGQCGLRAARVLNGFWKEYTSPKDGTSTELNAGGSYVG